MPTVLPVILCAASALVLWGGLGMLVARRLFADMRLVILWAPTIGWACQTSVALALSLVFRASIAADLAAALLVVAAGFLPGRLAPDHVEARRLWPAILVAGLLACIPVAGELPKYVAGGVQFAGPIFDHAKIALIDEMLRSGLPPANPVFAQDGGPGVVSYYYFWLFSAAQLGQLTGANGWEADIAMSWFTAVASLLLIGGLAVRISGRAHAAIIAILLTFLGSLRPALAMFFGQDNVDRVLQGQSGLAGWLLETSWSPHHVMAAGCVLISVVLLLLLAERPRALVAVVVLGLVANAGFQSSLWVGGITFGFCAAVVGAMLLWSTKNGRLIFLIFCCGAALIAAVFASPLIARQLAVAAAHTGGSPVVLSVLPVLGEGVPEAIRRWADLPAFWMIYVPVEFPVALLLGGPVLWRYAKAGEERRLGALLLATVAVSLGVAAYLKSTVGLNNDLGWRAVLPAVLVLNAAAGAGVAMLLAQSGRGLAMAAIAVPMLLAIPDTVNLALGNMRGNSAALNKDFLPSMQMWAAVRKYAGPDVRVANNPLFLSDITPWPINLSWALLSNRRSCFGGKEMAIAFTPMSPAGRLQVSDLFIDSFEGRAKPSDIDSLARDFHCDVVVVTPLDGAWRHDLFAASSTYRLAESHEGKWRIYVSRKLLSSAQ